MDDEKVARRTVRTRSRGICERCGRSRATDFSHRQARSQQGKWSAANGCDLCRTCHSRLHAHPEEAYALGLFVEGHKEPGAVPVRLRYGEVYLHEDGTVTPNYLNPSLPDDLTATLAALEGSE